MMKIPEQDMDELNGNREGIWFRGVLREPDGAPGVAILVADVLAGAIPVKEARKLRDELSHAIRRAEMLAKECGPYIRRSAKASFN